FADNFDSRLILNQHPYSRADNRMIFDNANPNITHAFCCNRLPNFLHSGTSTRTSVFPAGHKISVRAPRASALSTMEDGRNTRGASLESFSILSSRLLVDMDNLTSAT